MAELSLMGTNGQLYLYEDHIEIERKGFAARVTHRKAKVTSIAYEEIAGVKMHPGVFFISGYLHFKRKHGNEDPGLVAAATNKDCIVFRSYDNATAREIKKLIKKKI